jgi:hypothetical protein
MGKSWHWLTSLNNINNGTKFVSIFTKKQTDKQGEKEKYVYWQIEVIRSL